MTIYPEAFDPQHDERYQQLLSAKEVLYPQATLLLLEPNAAQLGVEAPLTDAGEEVDITIIEERALASLGLLGELQYRQSIPSLSGHLSPPAEIRAPDRPLAVLARGFGPLSRVINPRLVTREVDGEAYRQTFQRPDRIDPNNVACIALAADVEFGNGNMAPAEVHAFMHIYESERAVPLITRTFVRPEATTQALREITS